MASGNTLVVFEALGNQPPTSNYATLDTRNSQPCLDFDASTDESALFSAVLPRHYSGGGLTVTLIWAATSATSGTCRWDVSIERQADEAQDLDSDGFASAQSSGGTAPGTSGMLQYTSIAFTDGAQIDSLAVGERFRLKVTRDADGTGGTDDMTGDAELFAVEIRET
ncbi:MAG: hypothetical protein E6R03_10400 [Hyphomicrobiaceae bacterium]|nr:MAG: hypothetical protein E6R03_10400 [Hyphomicrobiaceae bacterium]